ncbi:MAG: hypothetical protein M0P57_10165 [Syntrophales bacterium]|nr:hypothetical protein [Syntrophales bacterium]
MTEKRPGTIASADEYNRHKALSRAGWNEVASPAEQNYPLSKGLKLALIQPDAIASKGQSAGVVDTITPAGKKGSLEKASKPLDRDSRQIERSRSQLEARLKQLNQKYGADWEQKLAANPDRIALISANLAKRHAEQTSSRRNLPWYRSLDQRVDTQTRNELDAQYGDNWQTAVAEAMKYRYQTIYCTENCGTELNPQARRRILDAKELIERLYGNDWRERAAANPQKLEEISRELEKEYGKSWWVRLESALRTYRPDAPSSSSAVVDKLDDRYGEAWRLAVAVQKSEREAALNKAWDEIFTQAEKRSGQPGKDKAVDSDQPPAPRHPFRVRPADGR